MQQWSPVHGGEAMVVIETENLLMWWPTGHCWARAAESPCPNGAWRSWRESQKNEELWDNPTRKGWLFPTSHFLLPTSCSIVTAPLWHPILADPERKDECNLQNSGPASQNESKEGFEVRYKYFKGPGGRRGQCTVNSESYNQLTYHPRVMAQGWFSTII